MNCEKDEFGKTLQYASRRDGTECELCRRDGQISLPRYLSQVETRDQSLVSTSVLEDGDVPCLCDEHFHELTRTPHRRTVVGP
ncbi:hypothetical protein ACFQO4_14675 [Saliphagus sp. GCM10025334]